METYPNPIETDIIRATPRQVGQLQSKLPPIDVILKERGSRYGKFKCHAEVTQKLKSVFSDHMRDHNDLSLSLSQAEAIDMIFHKLGRIANGNPNYADSWVDIVGYAQLIVDELNGIIR